MKEDVVGNKCNWLIENTLSDDDRNALVEACKNTGTSYRLLNRKETYGGEIDSNTQSPAILMGCINTIRYFNNKSSLYPLTYYSEQNYYCSNYYPKYRFDLLNSTYALYPVGDLVRLKYHLYQSFGLDDAIFIRPNSPNKPFTGQLFYKEHFKKDVEKLTYGMDQSELVVVSYPHNIIAEYRGVILDGEVISMCRYAGDFEGQDIGIRNFTGLVAKMYQPDRLFVLDTCITKYGLFKVLEINCFNCSGLYDCDREVIVNKVSKMCETDTDWLEN